MTPVLRSLTPPSGDLFAQPGVSLNSIPLEQLSTMSQDLLDSRPVSGMAIDRGPEQAYEAYHEEAFRHFLAIERKRAGRAGRSMVLLLVEFKAGRDGDSVMNPRVSSKLFSALTACVREIDFIGWYRSGRVAGAVLTQGAEAPAPKVSKQIGERVAHALSERLPSQVRHRIQVRILQLHSSVKKS